MKFSESSVTTQLEILKRHLDGELIVPVTLDSTAFTNGVCKAGNPIAANGKKDNATAPIGILLNDVYEENPNGAIVKAFAVINEANANANAGITISSATKTALSNIVFE